MPTETTQEINRAWVLQRRPDAAVSAMDLKLEARPIPSIGDGELLIRNLYLSLDPTNRLWMSDREQYLPPVEIGQVMRGGTLGQVVESRSDRFAIGDLVLPTDGGWQELAVVPAATTGKVRRAPGVPLTAYMSALGATGMTAYFGLLDIGQPKAGECVVITAAAGAVGSIVGQIAKIKGCRVIGIAGGAEKCRWLVDELGFDGAIDYKSQDVGSELDRLCPDGIDVSFENVGGPIMDAVFSRLNRDGRMALCGLISAYNQEGPMDGPTDFGLILMNRLTVRGFIVLDYLSQARQALTELGTWVAEGKLKWKVDVVQGIENAPDALDRLFSGANDGKLLVQLAEETVPER